MTASKNKFQKSQSRKARQPDKTTKDNTMKRKPTVLQRLALKSRKSVIKTVVTTVAVIAVIGAIPFPHTFAKNITVPFVTDDQKTQDLELGDSKVLSEGREGSKIVTVSSLQSLWGRLFGWQPIQQKEVSSTITEKPVDNIVANGTRKYQYMLCSDGSYRYYTDEQFKDENTGFTSKSEDYCKENNQGHKISLSDSNSSNVGISSVGNPTSTTQPDTYEADKINRQAEKLRWCNEQDEKFGSEYIGKVQQAQATPGITNQEFNAIVDPAYWKYSHNIGLLKASGCTISSTYPNYIR